VLLAFLTGGCLATGGAVFQSVLRNPLATPYMLGVSAGASLGAGLAMICTGAFAAMAGASLIGLALSGFFLPAAGFIFALGTVWLVVAFSQKIDTTMSNNTVILCGMVLALFVDAILTLLTALFREQLKTLVIWQMGSFAGRGWPYVRLLLPFMVVGLTGIAFHIRELDMLSFGEDEAKSAGVDADKVRKRLFLFSAVLSGASVSLSGTIGFVDLVAPHAARSLVGAKHSWCVPASFLCGGILLVAADLLARVVARPTELPVGAVTALVGAPFFAFIYFKKR
jgi:iron complex transport system permease protein